MRACIANVWGVYFEPARDDSDLDLDLDLDGGFDLRCHTRLSSSSGRGKMAAMAAPMHTRAMANGTEGASPPVIDVPVRVIEEWVVKCTGYTAPRCYKSNKI
jgi:hypothetical protein